LLPDGYETAWDEDALGDEFVVFYQKASPRSMRYCNFGTRKFLAFVLARFYCFPQFLHSVL
jgi:hypothetical protein